MTRSKSLLVKLSPLKLLSVSCDYITSSLAHSTTGGFREEHAKHGAVAVEMIFEGEESSKAGRSGERHDVCLSHVYLSWETNRMATGQERTITNSHKAWFPVVNF